jgi:PhoH-like ATPase
LKKRFLLDTNVLLHDPQSLEVFADNEVIIPVSVLDELDAKKALPDEKGRNARSVIRKLDQLRQKGSLSDGVPLDCGSILRVELNHCDTDLPQFPNNSVDNRILRTAVGLHNKESPVIVVTKDINLRVKCDTVGINAQDYERDKLAKTPEALYSGFKTINIPSSVIDSIYDEKPTSFDVEGFPNEFYKMESSDKSSHFGLGRRLSDGLILPVRSAREMWGIKPRNLEQKMAMNLLLDPEVKLVTLVGKAGSGKTLLAAAAALHYVMGEGTFQRALLSRPVQPMGRDIGFLPGTVEEKLEPWMAAINDNLELLMANNISALDQLKSDGIIQVEPLTYIRGRSIPNSLVIVDECQNLTRQEVKTIVTRVGEGSRIILTGDVEQIDNPYVDFASNGLTQAVELLKSSELTGHITFHKCERSGLAEVAAEVL